MFRSYGTFGACLLAVYVIFELSLLVRAASSDGSAGQVRFVSSSAEYDSELVWNVPSDDPVPIASSNALKICDCEYALPRYHGGLLCNKEGYFITNFEAVGHWINGGGRVPLSRAKCCRLCLPEELTPAQEQALPAGANFTALISVGCHASTSKSKVSCETEPTTTFATGFQKAILVPSLASATYYPEGPMTCCVPALMLSTGDAWEIERCNCEWSKSTGCESISPDHILWGYGEFREGGAGAHVPIAPAQCCKACIGDQLHNMDQCRSLNHCSRRGVCVLGACACNEGWGGADCSHALSEPSWPPAWVVYTAVAASTIVSMVLWLASRQLLSDYIERRRQAQDENQSMLDPLMIAEGEIGGDDSTDEECADSPTQAAAHPSTQPPVSTPPATPSSAAVQAHAGGADDADSASLLATTADTAPSEAPLRDAADGAADEAPAAAPATASTSADSAASAAAAVAAEAATTSTSAVASAVAAAAEEAAREEEAERLAEVEREFDERISPLSHVRCKICFERPVQVALVPCGHSNLCRHCARRMEFCPFCRKPVVRRQRLYLADT